MTNVPADIDQNKEFPQTILENGTKTRYVDSEFFKVDRYQLNGKNVIKNDEPFMMVSIIEGTGIFEGNEVVKQFDFIDADIQFKVVSNQLNIILNNVNYTKSIFLNRKMIFILKKSIERELLKVPKRYIN